METGGGATWCCWREYPQVKVQEGCRRSVMHETLVGKRRGLAVLAHTAVGQQTPADTDGSVIEEKEGHNMTNMTA